MSANKHGHGPHSSRLQNWLEHELVHLAMNDRQDALEADLPDRNISLRVPVMTHLMLMRLAQKLGRSKTACGEEILTNAVRDVYEQSGLPHPTEADVREYTAQTEKGPAEPAAPIHKTKRAAPDTSQ